MIRLLLSLVPSARRLVPSGHGVVTVTFFGLVAGLEFLGRSATSDLHDGLAALVLASAIALVATRHRRSPLPWVSWLGGKARFLLSRIERVKYDQGIDLRGTPRFPRRLPPVTWVVLAVLTTWAIIAGSVWYFFPIGWRELGLNTSYVIYLVVLLGIWSGLLVCMFVGVYLKIQLLDSWLKGITNPSDRRKLELGIIILYMLAIAGIAYVVPTIFVLAVCVAVGLVAVAAVVRPSEDEPAGLWRSGPGRPIYAVPFNRLVAGGLGLAGFIVFDLLLTACGGRLLSPFEQTDTMPVTALLGTAAAWMVPGLVIAAVIQLWAIRRSDPSRRTPPTVHLSGHRPAEERKLALDTIVSWGWSIRPHSDDADSGDIKIELVSPEQSQATEFEPRWPLKVSLDDLTSIRVKDRLERRDQIQLRRQVFRGLSVLFKKAVAERTTRGGGYWFHPQWWFQGTLEREEMSKGRSDQPTPPRPIGPPYRKVFAVRARQHLHEILQAVQIDIVYIEDGVGRRSIEKVMRSVFELYDRTGGKRKADDLCFRALPKVRVMIHEYAPGKPFQATGYREPKFDDLSRARVLHIFRDHGGDEADVEVPFDFSWEPSPVLGMG